MSSKYLLPYVKHTTPAFGNSYYRRYYLGTNITKEPTNLNFAGSVYFDHYYDNWTVWKDVSFPQRNCKSLEEAKNILDEMLIKDGYILLTEEEAQKLEVLV